MSDAVDSVDFYTRAAARFGEQLSQVTDEHLDLATPCAEWDVETLVTHVVMSELFMKDMLEGRGVPDNLEVGTDILGSHPMAAWRGTVLPTIEALNAPGALDQQLLHPIGLIPAQQVVHYRVSDNLAHAWDLAQALGSDFVPDDDLAEWCLDGWLPLVDQLEASEWWAGPIQPPADAPAGVRLLALLGRQAFDAA